MKDMRDSTIDATYYFEYVLETYNKYVEKLMFKTCEIWYEYSIFLQIQNDFECFREDIDSDINFCNNDDELCFEGDDCNYPVCYEQGLSYPFVCTQVLVK